MQKLLSRRTYTQVNVYREVLFDQSVASLKPIPGEAVVLDMYDVEDTKAGKYERGRLLITTLRVMWFSSSTKHVNLSIGLQTVQKLDVSNKLRSDVPPLHVLSHFKTTKFEFIFTPRSRAKSHELLQTVDLLIREFNATQKVREVRMRANLTDPSQDHGKFLSLMEGEEIYETIPGVMNLSKDHGQLGTLWVTSLRVAWAAQLQDNYNCSVPYLQVKDTRSQQTKFGTVLVVETFSQPQRFLLGFQINPAARMDEVLKCIQNLLRSFRAQPDFGICVERITDPQIADEADMEMFDTVDEAPQQEDALPGDGLAAYYAADPSGAGEPVFDESIGLTVEAMPQDVTLKTLWSVL